MLAGSSINETEVMAIDVSAPALSTVWAKNSSRS